MHLIRAPGGVCRRPAEPDSRASCFTGYLGATSRRYVSSLNRIHAVKPVSRPALPTLGRVRPRVGDGLRPGKCHSTQT
jgi:hypothetical protein